ncbi:MAG: LemA family protein [Candidatus Pacebacteria bacterium]|nr:LemA family protein [Candidatus Paceibacterota bacterium]
MQDFGYLLISFIPLFLAIIMLLIIFNIWYIGSKVKRQTEDAVKSFHFEIERRISLISEMIFQVGKYASSKMKKPFEKDFNDMIKKFGKISFTEAGQSITKEVDSILKTIIGLSQKYPNIISSSKFKSLRTELEKFNDIVKSFDGIYTKSVGVFSKWADRFPFSMCSKFAEDIDKKDEKYETEENLKEEVKKDVKKATKKKPEKKEVKKETKKEVKKSKKG